MRRRNRSSTSRSPARSTGLATVSTNRCGHGYSPGATIDSSDHSSMRRFSIGVPVIASRNGTSTRRTAW